MKLIRMSNLNKSAEKHFQRNCQHWFQEAAAASSSPPRNQSYQVPSIVSKVPHVHCWINATWLGLPEGLLGTVLDLRLVPRGTIHNSTAKPTMTMNLNEVGARLTPRLLWPMSHFVEFIGSFLHCRSIMEMKLSPGY